MPFPSGQYSRLFFNKESTPGVLAPLSNVNGLRVYHEEFQITPRKTPVRYQENRGGTIADHVDFVNTPTEVTARFRFALRYSGVHAAILGWALGDLDTTDTGPNYIHTADGAGSGQYVSWSAWIQVPFSNSAVGAFSEGRLLGCKVSRLRMSQSVQQPYIMCEVDLVAMESVWATTEASSVPPDADGFSPDEALIQSSHLRTAPPNQVSLFDARSQTAINLEIQEWGVELNNFPDQQAYISNSQIRSEPTRGQTREVTGFFVMDQAVNDLDAVQTVFGLLGTDAHEDFGFQMGYTNPALNTQLCDIWASQCYITTPERGISGTGPQARRIEFAAHGKGPGSALNKDFPLTVAIQNQRREPLNYTGLEYADFV